MFLQGVKVDDRIIGLQAALSSVSITSYSGGAESICFLLSWSACFRVAECRLRG